MLANIGKNRRNISMIFNGKKTTVYLTKDLLFTVVAYLKYSILHSICLWLKSTLSDITLDFMKRNEQKICLKKFLKIKTLFVFFN
jgi:hypothetical protein